MSSSTVEDRASTRVAHDNNYQEGENWILPFDMEDDDMTDTELKTGRKHPLTDLQRRREQEVEALEEKVCKFFLNLNTTSALQFFDLFNGIVFRLRSRNVALEITTLELDLDNFAGDSTEVKVFTRIGNFNATTGDHLADPASWTEVTTDMATAVPIADRKTAIIPSTMFQPVMMEPKESRLFYVALSSDTPLVKSSTIGTKFNEDYVSNNELFTHVGYGVEGGAELWVGDIIENQPFHGVVHYETKLPCEDQRDSFVVELPYFVDQVDPAAIVISLTNNAILGAVSRAMSRDAKLIRMQNIEGLRFQAASTETEAVPHEGPCPFGWTECTKLVVKIPFGHDNRLQPGLVHYEVLKYATDFNVSTSPFELGYVGKMPLSLDYFITLTGAPKAYELDNAQENYFGMQTAKFLADMTGEEILAAGLVPTKKNTPDNDVQVGARRNRLLQPAPAAKIHTAIYGAYAAWPPPQHATSIRGVDSMATVEILQSAFDDNATTYVQYLKDGLLRPGPINEENKGDFFRGVTATDAELDESSLWMPTSAPTPAPTFDPNAEEPVWGMPKSTLTILSILLVVVAALLFLLTLYWEHQYRREEKKQLKRNARAAQRKVDKLRAEQYRRVAEEKKQNHANGNANASGHANGNANSSSGSKSVSSYDSGSSVVDETDSVIDEVIDEVIEEEDNVVEETDSEAEEEENNLTEPIIS